MQDINTTITTNFNDNIEYIQTRHPKLFKKLSALDAAIENGDYADKYELVYENNGFDVLEKSSQTHLYAKESLAHSIISANSIDYKTDHNFFEGFVRHEFTEEEVCRLEEKDSFTDYKSSISPIINYVNKNSTSNKELKNIEKFIFFGTGLGMHIESINEKIKSKVYFIIEDDLELFRLSLFTVNYKQLATSSKLFFSVFENLDEFMLSSSEFLDENYELNHYIKFFHLLSHNQEKIDNFKLAVTSQPHIRFLFTDLMKQYLQPLEYLSSNYDFLNNSTSFFDSKFKDIPFLLLAMGPSLQNKIDWLKDNHKKFITIAVSSSLSFLEEHKIVPNIIVHIDPFEWGITSFNKLKSLEFIKKSICLFSTSSPKNIVSLIEKDMLFFFETGTDYKDNTFKLSGPCVGSLAVQLLLVLKAKSIYTLGLDLAVDNITGKTHAGNHQENQELDVRQDTAVDIISYKETLFEVEGNLSHKVKTTPGYYASIYTVEHFANSLKSDFQSIYNLSNGAKFSNTIPLNTDSINIENEIINNNINEELALFFKQNSQNTQSNKELKIFMQKMEHAKRLKSLIDQNDTINVSNLLPKSEISKYELSRILDAYSKYIGSFVFDFFNATNIENEDLHTKVLTTMLNKELSNIAQYYINLLTEKLNARY